MQPQTIDSRVERLETRVTALEQLPARMDAFELRLSQFQDEVRVEFSATRSGLRQEIRELSAQMRMLHEDVLSRLALIQESLPRRRKQR